MCTGDSNVDLWNKLFSANFHLPSIGNHFVFTNIAYDKVNTEIIAKFKIFKLLIMSVSNLNAPLFPSLVVASILKHALILNYVTLKGEGEEGAASADKCWSTSSDSLIYVFTLMWALKYFTLTGLYFEYSIYWSKPALYFFFFFLVNLKR